VVCVDARWVTKSNAEIDKRRERQETKMGRLPAHHAARVAKDRAHIESVKKNHEQLLSSLRAVGAPYIRVAAVFAGD
jgi:hypothetical protein